MGEIHGCTLGLRVLEPAGNYRARFHARSEHEPAEPGRESAAPSGSDQRLIGPQGRGIDRPAGVRDRDRRLTAGIDLPTI